jgi:hypothetical protein
MNEQIDASRNAKPKPESIPKQFEISDLDFVEVRDEANAMSCD